MGTRIPAGLNKAPMTAAEGRKFGLTVGLAFIAIGAVLLWRQHPTKATVVLALGGALALSGLIIPTLLRPVERAWMGLALLISKVTTPIFMGIVYFVVITPTGFIRKRAGNGSLIARKRGQSSWIAHSPAVPEGSQMERQF